MQVIKRLSKFVIPYWKQIILVILALIVTSSSLLSLGWLLMKVIDQANLDSLTYWLIKLFVISLLFSCASFIRSYSIYAVCEKIVFDIRNAAYQSLLYKETSFFEVNKTSDIISRLTSDSLLIANIISDTLSFALRNSLLAIGAIVMMFRISVELSFSVIIVFPILVFPAVLIIKKIRLLSKENQEKISVIGFDIEETFNAIKTIHSFNLEEYKTENFKKITSDALNSNISRLFTRSILVAIIIFLTLMSLILVVVIGIKYIQANKLTLGELTSFVFYAITTSTSLAGVSQVVSELQRSMAACERLLELIDENYLNKISNANNDVISFRKLQLDNLSFSYPSNPSDLVIKQLSLTIEKGEFVAIVGKSGEGKTTIFSLLQKFYNDYSGDILINNKNIKEYTTKSVRDLFTIVPQDPFIFSATILENILIASPESSVDSAIDACKMAGIYDYIVKLPKGINTYVGEKGVRLSGGQRQRIAIARALMRDPQVLLLDEATSALDNSNESEIQYAINQLMRQKTIIVIAHRIATIEKADRIIVLESGKIKSVGNHHELMNNCSLYQELATKQVSNNDY